MVLPKIWNKTPVIFQTTNQTGLVSIHPLGDETENTKARRLVTLCGNCGKRAAGVPERAKKREE